MTVLKVHTTARTALRNERGNKHCFVHSTVRQVPCLSPSPRVAQGTVKGDVGNVLLSIFHASIVLESGTTDGGF